jgi:fructose-1,6-bisphosphatase/inositol monophosphatase family enzyme
MITPDIQRVERIIRDVAEEEIRPRFRKLSDSDIWNKEKGGIVTVADFASEKKLGEALTSLVPGSVLLAEEAVESGEVIDPYACLDGDLPVWIIDPLDGTRNFSKGKEQYAVIVAYAVGGYVRAGWILAPETGEMVIAEEGAGAWSGDQTLTFGGPSAPRDMSGTLGRRIRASEDISVRFGQFVNQRSCGIEYMMLARGELHFVHYRRLKPWDHAAGVLIAREAGGHTASLNGDSWRPGLVWHHGMLTACGREQWEDVANIIRPVVLDLFGDEEG